MNRNNGMEVDTDSGCEIKSKSTATYDNERRGNDHELNVKLKGENDRRKSGERYSDRERRSYEERRQEDEARSRSELYYRKGGYKTNKQYKYFGGERNWDMNYRRQGRSSAEYGSYPSYFDRDQRYNGYRTHSRRSPFPSHRREGERNGERGVYMGVGWDGGREAGRARSDFPGRNRKEREKREAGIFEEENGIKGWVTGQPT